MKFFFSIERSISFVLVVVVVVLLLLLPLLLQPLDIGEKEGKSQLRSVSEFRLCCWSYHCL